MSFDAHKNFAVSTIATIPSPATSGASLVVASGHGARFPAVPFNATVWPANAMPDPSNAEIVRVTAISTDTLTITRHQEGTTARSVGVGDQIAAGITAKTLTDVETNAMHYLAAFDTAASYAVDDVVTYHNKLYLCTTAVTPAASSYVGSSTQGSLQAGGTIALPAGSASGDLVIITISDYTGGGSTKPSYATAVASVSSGGVHQQNISSYVLAGADITAGTLTIPGQSGPSTVVILHVFRNVARGIDTANVASTGTLSTSAVTPSDACFLLEIASQVNSSGTGLLTASWSPSGYAQVSAGGANTADAAGGYETLAAGATSSVRTFVNPAGTTSNAATTVVPILTGAAFNSASWVQLAKISDYLAAVTASGTAQAVPDPSTADESRIVLTGNCTFTFPTAAAGKRFRLALVQDGTGSRTVTWPGTAKWSGGTAPTLTTTASKTDVFEFTCYDGTNWVGQTLGQNY